MESLTQVWKSQKVSIKSKIVFRKSGKVLKWSTEILNKSHEVLNNFGIALKILSLNPCNVS